ncbi:MAG: 50S ribosomal protein L21 [Gammaproteobacteria bacterium]|nr:50S ribosomal protein L21 [Gammaproteobacteria bacterium]MYD80160.1 50S ribosomal protein L21 [Gammaproteobacteria bacterium]
MYAVFESGGKQHRASQGDFLSLELLKADPGDEVAFDNVMLVSEGEEVSVGNPFLPKSRVLATVVRHERLKKVRVIKFKRRKNYLRRAGHRQWVTVVQVTSIEN